MPNVSKKVDFYECQLFIKILYFLQIADSSLEYASLLPVQGEVMPDDELDANNPLINTADDYDEFLPSSSTAAVTSQKSLFKLQYEDEDDEDDEFASSLMAAAQGKIQFHTKRS